MREDNSPTVHIINWNHRLLYKDWGCPEHSFDCFEYIKYKYNTDFYGTLRLIDSAFGLGLSAGVRLSRTVRKVERETKSQTPSRLLVRTRNWEYRDKLYWEQFGITKDILRIFDVKPITHVWINEQRFSCNSISYRYRFDCGYKIYRPLERDFKWFSNVGSECIQGYRQLPERGKTLVLTSSLKDVMCLAVLDYPSIALQSEMLVPSEGTIKEAQARFEEVIVLYDNDFNNERNPGQTMARKICSRYGLDNIVIPSYYGSKDISDLVRDHGLQTAKDVIERKENRCSYHKEEST